LKKVLNITGKEINKIPFDSENTENIPIAKEISETDTMIYFFSCLFRTSKNIDGTNRSIIVINDVKQRYLRLISI
jgi:hypothetical protein